MEWRGSTLELDHVSTTFPINATLMATIYINDHLILRAPLCCQNSSRKQDRGHPTPSITILGSLTTRLIGNLDRKDINKHL